MFRVDFRSTHVHYLNNLEEDAKYKWWRTNLNEVNYYMILESDKNIIFKYSCFKFSSERSLFCILFRSWCQSSLVSYVKSVKIFSMLFLFLIQQPVAVLRQVYSPRLTFSHCSLYVFLSEISHCIAYCFKILQSIDMIISLYENTFPVRFGIVLYSSKYIRQLEDHSAKEDGDKFEDDLSNMVIFTLKLRNTHIFIG